jgi:poly(3-hydroxybutyrate) depolymerase
MRLSMCLSMPMVMTTLALLAGCGGGSSDSGGDTIANGKQLPDSITMTRSECTPFGDAPRVVQTAANALFAPSCEVSGEKLDSWSDSDGTARHACLYEPPQASTDAPLPLVIWLHPSIAGTDISLALSNVRAALATADLNGDAAHPGFILLAPYGRVTPRYYPFPDDGLTPGWDNWYRQLAPGLEARTVNGTSYPMNVDAAAIDHYLAQVLAMNKVDRQRIYIMGWSNGSAMATLYAVNRPEIAAAAIYSSPNPYAAFNDPCTQQPTLNAPADDTQAQVLAPGIPIFHVHNDCDIAGLCPNSQAMEAELAAGANTPVESVILNTARKVVSQCLAICGTDPMAGYAGVDKPAGYVGNLPGYTVGTLNHLSWPFQQRDAMFAYLREHSRP